MPPTKIPKDLGSFHPEDEQIQKTSVQEQYFDPNLSKKKKIIFWLYLIALLGFIIAVLTLVTKAYDPVKQHLLSDDFYFANQVVSEWNQGFVTDIKVVNSTVSPDCPAGYEHAFTYKWRGTGFGCLCVSGENTTFVLEAYCSPALIQANCTNIPSQNERESHFWSNNANICVKRSVVNFANEQKFDNTNKICGSSQSLIVVPMSEPCPLVNISMSSFSLQDHIYTAIDLDQLLPPIFGAYNSTSPYSFYSYPITKFSVSEDTFCQINDDTGVSSSHMDFVLLSVPRGCAQPGNYSTITQTTEHDFYTNNPNLFSLTQISGFPQAGNWKYKLGFAAVGSWTYKCRHNLNGKFSIEETSKQFNFQIYGFLEAGSFVMIACGIVIGIEVFLLGLRRCVDNSIYPVGYKQRHMPEQFWWAMSRYIIDLVCKILIVIFSAIFAYNGYMDWHWYKEVQNQKCHHDSLQLVHNIINPYQKLHFVLFEHSMAVFFIAIVMLVVDVFHFCYVYNNQLSFYLIESNQVLVDKDAEDKKDSLDRINDLKWLDMDHVDELEPSKNDDELRVTMGHNLFAYEDNQGPILRPKKGKKPARPKKLFSRAVDNRPKDQTNVPSYLLDDDIFGLDNITDQPSTTVLKPMSSLKVKKPANRRKK